jgi:hypothetical protein
MSQSFVEESVHCTLNHQLVTGLNSSFISMAWANNIELPAHQTPKLEVPDGSFNVTVSSKGMLALKISGTTANTRLHKRILPSADASPPLSPLSRAVGFESGPFGIVSGMALNWGTSTELYAFSQANSTMFGPQIWRDARATSHVVFDLVQLHWVVDGRNEQTISGTMFPFDFSVPLSSAASTVTFWFSGVSSDGRSLASQHYTLEVLAVGDQADV